MTVEVKQIDREAAARFDSSDYCEMIPGILAGQHDDIGVVQSYAEHRIAAENAVREEIVKILQHERETARKMRQYSPDDSPYIKWFDGAEHIAVMVLAHIRAGSTGDKG